MFKKYLPIFKEELMMLKKYLCKVWLPFHLPNILTLGTIFLIVEYVDAKTLFFIRDLPVTNIQVLTFIPPSLLLIYGKILNYFYLPSE